MPHLIRLALIAVATLGTVLPAGAAVDLAAPIAPGPQVTVGKLPNGLTYYIQRNAKPEHKLELRLAVKAGSVLEEDNQRGLAHMVEHLAFNGSTHFRKQELVSYLQSIGVKFGADLNAYTSFDETVYMLPVPTGNPENVDKAFTVLEDWAHGVTLNDDDVDKERAIVLEEARQRKGAMERLQKVLLPKLFNGSRYAVREPVGTEEVIRNARPDALRRFYHDWYRPDLMAVIVVGDIDPAEAERLIKAHFTAIANPQAERPRNYPDIAPVSATEAVIFTDAEIPANSVALRYPLRQQSDQGTYGSYRAKMIEQLSAMMLNQRLAEIAQQPNAPFMGAGIAVQQVTPRHKAYAAGAALGSGGAAPAITALLQEQQRVRQYGFSAPELERARKAMLSRYEHAYNQRDTTDSAAYAGEYLRNFLAGESIGGIAAEYRLVQELLPAITLEDTNNFIRQAYPADAGKLVVYVGGTKDGSAPTGKELLADVSAAEHAQVATRVEKALASRLMERPAKPGAIVDETRDARLGITRLTLSNGVKVILKPSTFHKDQVLLGAQRFGGQMLFDQKDIPNARVASTVASVMGLGDFSPLELQKMLAGRNVQIVAGLGNYTDEVSGSSGSSAEDLETLFQAVWLRFHGVRRDEGLYKSYMARLTEMVRNRAAAPEARFGDAIVDTLYAGHPYEPREPSLQDLARVNLDRSIALDRQRFSSAKGLTFVLVGDFDPAALKPLITSYLGTLPTPDLPLAYRDVGLRFAKGVVKKEVKAGTEPKSVVSLTFSGPAAWSPAERLRMEALVEVMNLRVVEVLREKLGLIYSGRVTGSVQHIPYQHYSINATLPTGPDKVDKLLAALFSEIERIKTEGPAQAELDKVKANWRQSYEQSQHENGYWRQNLQASVIDGTDPMRLLTIQDEIAALTTADLRQAAVRYFKMDNYVQVVLNPEDRQKTAAVGSK